MSGKAVVNQLLLAAVERSSWDPAYFCRFFLRNWFPSELPPFHLGMIALITRKVSFLEEYPDAHEFLLKHFVYAANPADPTSVELPVFQRSSDGTLFMVAGQHNNEIVPRGFSKTTTYNAMQLYEAITDGTTFSVYISSSQTHAETQLGNIRYELENNEELRAAYGDVVPTRADSEKWTSDQLQLKNGAVLVARGRGSQVRGMVYRARRPNKILLDDVEDEESVSTAIQRKKTLDWFYGAVMPAGNEMDGRGDDEQSQLQITNLGTLLGAETLCLSLAKDPTFNTVRFGAKLSDGSMLWAYKMSAASYEQKRANAAVVGRLSIFAREYDSTIRVDEDAVFAEENIKLYQAITRPELIQVSIAMDPAISEQPGRDHLAIVVAGRDHSGTIFMLEEWGGLGISPRQAIDKFFELVLRWRTTKQGIESQQYQAALIHLMREEMARRQYFFEITPIVQGSKVRKDDRIAGILAPRYSNGYIRHAKPLPKLQEQLADFPNGKKDYADAAAMALSLLGETATLVAEDGVLEADDYEPLSKTLKPLYHAPTGYIQRNPQRDRFAGRYGNRS